MNSKQLFSSKFWNFLVDKKNSTIECFRLERLSTGKNEIVLAENTSAKVFKKVSNKWNKAFKGSIRNKIESPYECLWNCSINGKLFCYFWEGMDGRVVFSSAEQSDNDEVQVLFNKFSNLK